MLPAKKALPIRKMPKEPKVRVVPREFLPVAGETEMAPYAVERLRKVSEKAQALEKILSEQE